MGSNTDKRHRRTVSILEELRQQRLTKPNVEIRRSRSEELMDLESDTYRIERILITRNAEKEYALKPKENIPEMKIEDFSHNLSDWKNFLVY